MTQHFQKAANTPLRGCIRLPGDKSISHRALLFNAMGNGSANVGNLLQSSDVASTMTCLQQLGVSIQEGCIEGCGGQFQAPESILDCGNSGTTIRLLTGILAGQNFTAKLTGDTSLQGRPMARVTGPLTQLGADVSGPDGGRSAPFQIQGGPLINRAIHSPVASAQVKTAVMLAAIQGHGTLLFSEPAISRDHSERMFRAMGVVFEDWTDQDGTHCIRMEGPQQLQATDLEIPGDISSAAFFLVAASVVPGSDLLLQDVGLNPTRTGIIDVLRSMGASIDVTPKAFIAGEPTGHIRVRHRTLRGTTIRGSLVPRLVDEIPVLSVAAAAAEGTTIVEDAHELRFKESDRIDASVHLARSLGAVAEASDGGFTINGKGDFNRGTLIVDAKSDHRVAMSAVIGGLINPKGSRVEDIESISTSFPNFINLLGTLGE